ncbi:MAG TPA: hypothetical protein VHA13_00330, partial [Gammaproteobacteria bacterium]|nr:hypothetical protein [Gammaproteobacteria bacterium]
MLSQSNPTLIAMQTKEGSRGNVNNVIHRPIPIRMQSNSNNLNTNSQVNSKLYVPTDPSQTIKNTIKEQLKPHIRNFLGSEIFNQGHSITGINALMTIRTDTCTTTHSAAVQCYLSKELAERKLSAEVGFDELNHLTNTLFQKCNGQLQNCVNAEFEFNLLFKISEFPKLHFINELINKDLNTLISSLGRSILHYVKNDLAKLQLTYPAIIHFVFPIACVLPPDYSPHKKILRKNTTYKYELNIRSSEQLKELMSQKQINKLLLDDSQFLLKFRQTITTLLNKVDANLSECSLMKGYEPISKTIKTSYSPLPSTSENVQK